MQTAGKDGNEVKEFAKHQTFGRLFCNSFKFYGRFTAVCYSHNSKLGRATKALSLATQVMLVATIVSMFGLFGSETGEESWRLAGYEIFAVFCLMRMF